MSSSRRTSLNMHPLTQTNGAARERRRTLVGLRTGWDSARRSRPGRGFGNNPASPYRPCRLVSVRQRWAASGTARYTVKTPHVSVAAVSSEDRGAAGCRSWWFARSRSSPARQPAIDALILAGRCRRHRRCMRGVWADVERRVLRCAGQKACGRRSWTRKSKTSAWSGGPSPSDHARRLRLLSRRRRRMERSIHPRSKLARSRPARATVSSCGSTSRSANAFVSARTRMRMPSTSPRAWRARMACRYSCSL
jgi:hypothetical protein